VSSSYEPELYYVALLLSRKMGRKRTSKGKSNERRTERERI
jgi:hypothetical protein